VFQAHLGRSNLSLQDDIVCHEPRDHPWASMHLSRSERYSCNRNCHKPTMEIGVGNIEQAYSKQGDVRDARGAYDIVNVSL